MSDSDNDSLNTEDYLDENDFLDESSNESLDSELESESESELKSKTYKYIDLCHGIGGFRVAFDMLQLKNKNIKFECVLSADIKEDAIKTYNLNFNEKNKKLDIWDIKIKEMPNFNILCAGFCCQPFSSAGLKKGLSDDRGQIIFQILNICREKKPEYVILENVPNLLLMEDGAIMKQISNEFIKLGYKVSYKIFNSKDFNVPQNRERIFIICTKLKKIDLNKVKISVGKKLLKDVIETNQKYTDIETVFAKKIIDLHKTKPLYGYKMQDKRGGENNIHSWDIGVGTSTGISVEEKELISKIMTERRKKKWAELKKIVWMDGMPLTEKEIFSFYPNKNLKKMLNNLVEKNYLKLEKPKDLVNNKRIYKIDAEEGYNICKGKLSFPISNILDPNDISPTLTATDSSKLVVIIDDKYLRKLTINELKLICGFPLNFKIPDGVNAYDLFGNMAIPMVIYAILDIIF